MRYLLSYRFVFDNPHWFTNVLACAACVLFPFIGWTLLVGYLADLLESTRDKPADGYPNFDIDRVGHFLARGFPPALAAFVLYLPVVLIGLVMVGTVAAAGPPGRGLGTAPKLLAGGLSLVMFLLGLLISLLLVPLTLHLILSAELSPGAAVRFAVEFFRQVAQEVILAQVFVVVTGLALFVVGLLLCGLGAPPALALASFCQYHLLGQLYQLYLKRGGTPIPAPPTEPATSNA